MAFTTLAKQAVDLRVDQSKSLFQLGLLVTGALWALILAKKDDVRIEFVEPEFVMFACSNLVLLFFDWISISFLGSVGYALHSAAAIDKNPGLLFPDIFDSPASSQFEAQ